MKKGLKKLGEKNKSNFYTIDYKTKSHEMMQTSITSYKIDLHSLHKYDIQHLSSIARSAKYLIFKTHKYKKEQSCQRTHITL